MNNMNTTPIGRLIESVAAIAAHSSDEDTAVGLPSTIEDDLLSHTDNPLGDMIRRLANLIDPAAQQDRSDA